MTEMEQAAIFAHARSRYEAIGVDVEAALKRLAETPISIHCWQGDDVRGFETGSGELDGGIQVTGSHPGAARTPEELMADFREAIARIPGPKRINLHAIYAVMDPDDPVERDALRPKDFAPWVDFARENDLGIDFNPTLFSSPHMRDGLSLSSPDEKTRQYWIRHCQASRRISAWIAEQLGDDVLCNIWIPDGLKDIPGDRMGPRERLADSLDQIFAEPLDGVLDAVESKVFGIGLESYTVGSHDFYLGYALSRPGTLVLIDSGHYHPTENVADKLSALLLFFDEIPMHVTRSVRWDSDHVLVVDNELLGIAREIVRCHALDRVRIGLDFFDGSVNRVAAWISGTRAMQKALLRALLEPNERLREHQDAARWTELLVEQDALFSLPFGAVWDEYCRRQGVPDDWSWLADIQAYEEGIIAARG